MKSIVQVTGLCTESLGHLLMIEFPSSPNPSPLDMYVEFRGLFAHCIGTPFEDNFLHFLEKLIIDAEEYLFPNLLTIEKTFPTVDHPSNPHENLYSLIGELEVILRKHGFHVTSSARVPNAPIIATYQILKYLVETYNVHPETLVGFSGSDPVFSCTPGQAVNALRTLFAKPRRALNGLLFMEFFLPFFEKLLNDFNGRIDDTQIPSIVGNEQVWEKRQRPSHFKAHNSGLSIQPTMNSNTGLPRQFPLLSINQSTLPGGNVINLSYNNNNTLKIQRATPESTSTAVRTAEHVGASNYGLLTHELNVQNGGHQNLATRQPASDHQETKFIVLNTNYDLEQYRNGTSLMDKLNEVLYNHGYGVEYTFQSRNEPLIQAHRILHNISSKTDDYNDVIGKFKDIPNPSEYYHGLSIQPMIVKLRCMFDVSIQQLSSAKFMKYFIGYVDRLLKETSELITVARSNPV